MLTILVAMQQRPISKHPLYTTWQNMIGRCHRKSNPRYHRYGGRGIKVCAEWRNSFEQFVADMGPKPKGTSLHRMENDQDYCKENCKWGTEEEQRSNGKPGTHPNPRSVRQRAIKHGLKPDTLHARLRRGLKGKALYRKPHEGSVSALAAQAGISRNAVYLRLRNGWSLKRALSTPPQH
jgi:hypothetical protein